MYIVFFGTDRTALRNACDSYLNEKGVEKDNLHSIAVSEYKTGQMSGSLGTVSLFGGSEWFLIDTPSANSECADEVNSSLKEMSESVNNFILLEGKLLAPQKKKYQKYAVHMEEFNMSVKEDFKTFALAETLAQKDRRKLWILLQAANRRNQSPEAIIGLLWWQLKALRLAAVTSSASEAGMKDFPYRKANQAAGKFKSGELDRIADSLLMLYHDGHGGKCDLSLALEAWVLRG